MNKKVQKLVSDITLWNDLYRKGEPMVTDLVYDLAIEELRELDPENALLKKSVIEVAEDRMEKLPYPMFSLEKLKTIEELRKWFSSCNLSKDELLIVTPKFDGISLLKDVESQKVWTRGDGSKGQLSTAHYAAMSCSTDRDVKGDLTYVFGEAIISKANFEKIKGKSFDGKEYKVARNAVAGVFNSPTPNTELLKYIDFIPYGTDRTDWSKVSQLIELENLYGKECSPFEGLRCEAFTVHSDEQLLSYLNQIYENFNEYCIDGLVIEVNSSEKRCALGRLPNNNPRYAVAFKNSDWQTVRETTVVDLEINVGKDGNLTPVILIDPVEIGGATVSRITGFNMKYILDNNIYKSSKIKVTRSGEVIPKHLKTTWYDLIEKVNFKHEMFVCPCCGKKVDWDATETELVCTNPSCEGKVLSQIVYFFTTLEFNDFGRSTIERLFKSSLKSIGSILTVNPEQLLAIDGFGPNSAQSLLDQVSKLKSEGVCAAKLFTAYNVFSGEIAQKTCQNILNNLDEQDLLKVKSFEPLPIHTLAQIPGVGEKTAKTFNNGIQLLSEVDDFLVPISFWSEPKIEAAENQMSVCFTGVRDKELEDLLISKGHKVVSGVSKNTTHLIVKALGSGSSKEKKAIELGISILAIEDFKKQF